MADPKQPRHHDEAFKRQIVQLYENGKPAREIKDEYDISHSTPHRWVQGIRNSGSTKAADSRTPEQNEPVELRKRNRQLEMEANYRCIRVCGCPVPASNRLLGRGRRFWARWNRNVPKACNGNASLRTLLLLLHKFA